MAMEKRRCGGCRYQREKCTGHHTHENVRQPSYSQKYYSYYHGYCKPYYTWRHLSGCSRPSCTWRAWQRHILLPNRCHWPNISGFSGRQQLNSIEFLWPSLWLSFPQRRWVSNVERLRPKPSIGRRRIFPPGKWGPEQYGAVTVWCAYWCGQRIYPLQRKFLYRPPPAKLEQWPVHQHRSQCPLHVHGPWYLRSNCSASSGGAIIVHELVHVEFHRPPVRKDHQLAILPGVVFGTSGVGKLTIKVPFQLLNLTLDSAIVFPPQLYFTCQPFHTSDGRNHYILGKAFLQAAFLGMKWQQSKLFVAQALGPGTAAANLHSIEPTDETIALNQISDFASSWEKIWTPIAASSGNNASRVVATAPASAPSSGSGLLSDAKAGIAVGIAMGVLTFTVVLIFCLCLLKVGKVPLGQDSSHGEGEKGTFVFKGSIPPEKDREGLEYELGGEGLSHEAEAGNGRQLHEMDTRWPDLISMLSMKRKSSIHVFLLSTPLLFQYRQKE